MIKLNTILSFFKKRNTNDCRILVDYLKKNPHIGISRIGSTIYLNDFNKNQSESLSYDFPIYNKEHSHIYNLIMNVRLKEIAKIADFYRKRYNMNNYKGSITLNYDASNVYININGFVYLKQYYAFHIKNEHSRSDFNYYIQDSCRSLLYQLCRPENVTNFCFENRIKSSLFYKEIFNFSKHWLSDYSLGRDWLKTGLQDLNSKGSFETIKDRLALSSKE